MLYKTRTHTRTHTQTDGQYAIMSLARFTEPLPDNKIMELNIQKGLIFGQCIASMQI